MGGHARIDRSVLNKLSTYSHKIGQDIESFTKFPIAPKIHGTFIRYYKKEIMKLLLICLTFANLTLGPVWLTNFDEAKAEAVKSDKMILVSFSGSDWCIPCIRMEKQLFASAPFTQYAGKELILVKADFPRLKKNKLSKEQTDRNEQLASRYNPHGKFPLTLLLDKEGHVVKEWDGLPSETPDAFVGEINTAAHAGH